jgi:hypothetical protein
MDADILGTGALGFVLQKDDIPLNTPFLKNVESDNTLQYALFEFSNKVGAVITYLLIQAMNPANKITNDTKSSKEKDLDIRWWIDSATSSLRLFLLPIFQDMLSFFLADFKSLLSYFTNKDGSVDQERATSYMLQFMFHPPFYTLDERMISELLAELYKIYPSITAKLEWVKSLVPGAVAKQLHNLQHKSFRSNTQKSCKHTFGPVKNQVIRSKSIHNYVHWEKCHKTKIISTKL